MSTKWLINAAVSCVLLVSTGNTVSGGARIFVEPSETFYLVTGLQGWKGVTSSPPLLHSTRVYTVAKNRDKSLRTEYATPADPSDKLVKLKTKATVGDLCGGEIVKQTSSTRAYIEYVAGKVTICSLEDVSVALQIMRGVHLGSVNRVWCSWSFPKRLKEWAVQSSANSGNVMYVEGEDLISKYAHCVKPDVSSDSAVLGGGV